MDKDKFDSLFKAGDAGALWAYAQNALTGAESATAELQKKLDAALVSLAEATKGERQKQLDALLASKAEAEAQIAKLQGA